MSKAVSLYFALLWLQMSISHEGLDTSLRSLHPEDVWVDLSGHEERGTVLLAP